MHNNHTDEISYCPDCYNMAKGNKEDGKLSDWIKNKMR